MRRTQEALQTEATSSLDCLSIAALGGSPCPLFQTLDVFGIAVDLYCQLSPSFATPPIVVVVAPST